MPTITKNRYQDTQNFGESPYGNLMVLEFNVTTAANGAVVSSNSNAAVLAADVIRVGLLPAGFRIYDSLTIVSDAFTASVTGSIGFAYEDGVDDATVPQDVDYFGAGVTLATAGRYRASNNTVRPVTLPKPAWLTITTAGATHSTVAVADILITGEFIGV